jgi:hypothetical protein
MFLLGTLHYAIMFLIETFSKKTLTFEHLYI